MPTNKPGGARSKKKAVRAARSRPRKTKKATTPHTKLPRAKKSTGGNGGNMGYELRLSWTPRNLYQISIDHLIVNDKALYKDRVFASPPEAYPVEPWNGRFVVDWSITPKGQLFEIRIEIVNQATGATREVGSKKQPTVNTPWTPDEPVVRDAP